MLPENYENSIRGSQRMFELFPEMTNSGDRIWSNKDQGQYLFVSPIGIQWRCLAIGKSGLTHLQNTKKNWTELEKRQQQAMQQAILPNCKLLHTRAHKDEETETEYRIYLFAIPESYRFLPLPPQIKMLYLS